MYNFFNGQYFQELISFDWKNGIKGMGRAFFEGIILACGQENTYFDWNLFTITHYQSIIGPLAVGLNRKTYEIRKLLKVVYYLSDSTKNIQDPDRGECPLWKFNAYTFLLFPNNFRTIKSMGKKMI